MFTSPLGNPTLGQMARSQIPKDGPCSRITSNGSPCFLCVKLCELFVSKLDDPVQKMGHVSHNSSHGGYWETQTTQ